MTRGIVRRLVWAVAIVVAATTASSAFGFYFLGWPSGPKGSASLLTPLADGHHYPPGQGINPISTPVTTSGQNHSTDPGHSVSPKLPGSGPEPVTPEPGTLVLAAVGLGLAGLMRARCKRRQGTGPEPFSTT